jgi:hypothetical protein
LGYEDFIDFGSFRIIILIWKASLDRKLYFATGPN